MSKIKSFTIKLDNLSAQDIVKIQNEVKNQISKTQLVAHTQATKRKREGSENNSKPERASKKPKHLEKQKFMDVTIHSKRSDFHSGKLGDKVVNIQLTRRDFHVREPDPVNFIGAIEISTRSVELSKVPKPVKLVAATISLPVSKPQDSNMRVTRSRSRMNESRYKPYERPRKQQHNALSEARRNPLVEPPHIPSLEPQCNPLPEPQPVSQANKTKAITHQFTIGEIVWAKIRGHPHWPAKIKGFPSDRMVIVTWFNDYRTTKIYRTQIFKFLLDYDEYSKKLDETIGLRIAAQEALMCYGETFLGLSQILNNKI